MRWVCAGIVQLSKVPHLHSRTIRRHVDFGYPNLRWADFSGVWGLISIKYIPLQTCAYDVAVCVDWFRSQSSLDNSIPPPSMRKLRLLKVGWSYWRSYHVAGLDPIFGDAFGKEEGPKVGNENSYCFGRCFLTFRWAHACAKECHEDWPYLFVLLFICFLLIFSI